MSYKGSSFNVVNSLDEATISIDGESGFIKYEKYGAILYHEDYTAIRLSGTPADQYVWSPRIGVWVLVAASARIAVTAGANATLMVRVCNGLILPASGIAQLTAAFDLEEVGPNLQHGIIIDPPTPILPGDAIAFDFSGTVAAGNSLISLYMKRIY